MTTIGGVAFRHIDRLPRVEDQVRVNGLTIRVLEMDEHRIARVRVTRGGVTPGEGQAVRAEAAQSELPADGGSAADSAEPSASTEISKQ